MPGFFTAYVKAALWSSTDDDDQPLDRSHNFTDIDADTLGQMKRDCDNFQRQNEITLRGLDPAQAGRDFWLTRNGHGAGFWDGDYPDDIGERLTQAAEAFGEYCLYVGDDGKIHGT